MPQTFPPPSASLAPDWDVVVLGGGAAGLSAAVFAALDGARTVLLERSERVGGTSALSAGTVWVPNTRHAGAGGSEDTPERAAAFLDAAVGNRAPRAMREAFLAAGPEAIRRLEESTVVQFRARPFHPDYLSELEGSVSGTGAGGIAVRWRCARRGVAQAATADPRIHPPGRDDGRPRRYRPSDECDDVSEILRPCGADARRICGRPAPVRARRPAGDGQRADRPVVAGGPRCRGGGRDGSGGDGYRRHRHGPSRHHPPRRTGRGPDGARRVILASGGFARHPERRADFLPDPLPDHSPAAPGNTGALHDIALRLGARYGEGAEQPVFWAPVSRRKRRDGSMAVFPHFVLDRSKPGIISVGRDGRRFVNESLSYHQFVAAMYAANEDGATIPAFEVTDADGLRKYGLGMVRPGGRGLASFLADGYLVRADTLPELAAALEIDADGLTETVGRMKRFAETGRITTSSAGRRSTSGPMATRRTDPTRRWVRSERRRSTRSASGRATSGRRSGW
ncbi:MAG: FAD-dependent oxidoreductase [Thalassobaculum sp.]